LNFEFLPGNYLTILPHLALPLAASYGEIYLLQDARRQIRAASAKAVLFFIAYQGV
jgi:hypothetical protein